MSLQTRLSAPAMLLLLTAVAALAATPAAFASTGTATAPDGVAIHFTDQGEGTPALVFVHGWSCDGTYWNQQVKHFAATHRVVVIDLAGHGASGQERKAYTMESFGGDVAAVLQQLDLKGAVLVGHSMGGPVVVEAALAAPDRVAGLVGIDNFQNVNLKLPQQAVDTFLAPFEADFKPSVTNWVLRMFPAGADSALAAGIAADMASAPPAVGMSAIRELLRWFSDRATARLAELKVPLMCVSADLQPTQAAPMKALVPRYELRVLPKCGHFLMRENPAGFNALLAETVAAIAKP
ncbi:MAG: alpha/beta hydrolase [bacterium]|nr:alpha/beta hydrolase [bacterium]